jgi:hypothetical protein
MLHDTASVGESGAAEPGEIGFVSVLVSAVGAVSRPRSGGGVEEMHRGRGEGCTEGSRPGVRSCEVGTTHGASSANSFNSPVSR